MQKHELLERMVDHNRHQMELSQQMIEILVMQLKVLKNHNAKVFSIIQSVQNNNFPPELTNSMLANFADLKGNYHLFFSQCSEILIKQIKISNDSTLTLSNEYLEED